MDFLAFADVERRTSRVKLGGREVVVRELSISQVSEALRVLKGIPQALLSRCIETASIIPLGASGHATLRRLVQIALPDEDVNAVLRESDALGQEAIAALLEIYSLSVFETPDKDNGGDGGGESPKWKPAEIVAGCAKQFGMHPEDFVRRTSFRQLVMFVPADVSYAKQVVESLLKSFSKDSPSGKNQSSLGNLAGLSALFGKSGKPPKFSKAARAVASGIRQ